MGDKDNLGVDTSSTTACSYENVPAVNKGVNAAVNTAVNGVVNAAVNKTVNTAVNATVNVAVEPPVARGFSTVL